MPSRLSASRKKRSTAREGNKTRIISRITAAWEVVAQLCITGVGRRIARPKGSVLEMDPFICSAFQSFAICNCTNLNL